jgi:glycosyltransferase involved in cell wall biosynthesis
LSDAPCTEIAPCSAGRPGRRILMVVSFANTAGAQIAALRLARGLRERGWDPCVVFLYQQVAIDTPYHAYEVVLPIVKPSARQYLSIARAVVRLLRHERPDAVLTFLPLAHAIGQAAALLAGVRRRIAAHRMPIDTAQKPLRMVDLIYAWAGVYTDATAVSRSVLKSCARYPAGLKCRIPVIYNGLLDWTPSSLSPNEARRRLGIPDDRHVIVAVGRFVAQKNYPLLVRIIERLEDVLLVIAGDGPLRAEIEKDIVLRGLDRRILRLGNVIRPEIPHLVAAGDLFVQTSTYEGNSNSILEALRSRAVVVAHDIPEQREVLTAPDGRVAGALVPLNDVNAWVETIRRLLADPGAREAAREVADERSVLFRYDRMLDDYEALLRRCS